MITLAVEQTISGARHNFVFFNLGAAGVVKVIPLLVNRILSKSSVMPPADSAEVVAHGETVIDQLLVFLLVL